jgi:3'(2'), 5'-bisphosphate nucleotidase
MNMIDTAVQAAVEAGGAILEIYALDFDVEYKADDSPLTAADKAAHEIIVEALESTPYPVLSEESTAVAYEERRAWSTYWLVDPLDGTKEFIKKNGEFTVNIALVEDGVPVLGVVYVPVEHTLYLGVGPGTWDVPPGAWKALECAEKSVDEILASLTACRISGTPSGALRVVASKSHCNDQTRDFIAELEKKYGEAERVSSGSSLKLCLVAEGAADIYPRIAPTMEWDTAAAHAVVKAAGGEVFEYDENLPVAAYTMDRAGHGPHGMASANAMLKTPHSVHYNKENLLNPYFVVSGLHK